MPSSSNNIWQKVCCFIFSVQSGNHLFAHWKNSWCLDFSNTNPTARLCFPHRRQALRVQPVSETLHEERPPDEALQDSHKHQEPVSRLTNSLKVKSAWEEAGGAVCDSSHRGKYSVPPHLTPPGLCSSVYNETPPGGLQADPATLLIIVPRLLPGPRGDSNQLWLNVQDDEMQMFDSARLFMNRFWGTYAE